MEAEKRKKQKKRRLLMLFTAVPAAIVILVLAGRRKETVPVYVFSYAENQTADYPTTLGALKFAQLVEERTQGRIRIRVEAEGVLGSEGEVIKQMRYGGIDFARVSLSQISEYVPEMKVLQLPYLYEDSEHMWRVLDGEIGGRFLGYPQDCGLIGLSWYDAGARSFYSSTRPIETLEDMEGLRIRVQESAVMSEVITAMGAIPVQMPYDKVYAALERGQADGAENNWSSYEAMQHYEVAGYFTVDEHARVPEMQICAAHTWEQLSEQDRQIIRECARESALYERELWSVYERQARERALAAQVREIRLSPEEKEKFRAAIEPVYANYRMKYGTVIEEILACAGEREETKHGVSENGR